MGPGSYKISVIFTDSRPANHKIPDVGIVAHIPPDKARQGKLARHIFENHAGSSLGSAELLRNSTEVGTRNVRDFGKSPVPAIKPEDMLELLKNL